MEEIRKMNVLIDEHLGCAPGDLFSQPLLRFLSPRLYGNERFLKVADEAYRRKIDVPVTLYFPLVEICVIGVC